MWILKKYVKFSQTFFEIKHSSLLPFVDLATRTSYKSLPAISTRKVPYVQVLSNVIVQELSMNERCWTILNTAFKPEVDCIELIKTKNVIYSQVLLFEFHVYLKQETIMIIRSCTFSDHLFSCTNFLNVGRQISFHSKRWSAQVTKIFYV